MRPGKRIFISYGHDATLLAERLEDNLKAAEHTVWRDRTNIRAGRSWEEQIERAVLDHEVFVCLLTPHAVRRPDGVCLDEISLARYHRRQIVPLMVVPCRPPLGIYRLDWIDFQNWRCRAEYDRALARLIHEISDKRSEAEGQRTRRISLLDPLDFSFDLARLGRDFTGRAWIDDAVESWLAQHDRRLLVLTGDPGVGKSAYLAHLIHRRREVTAFHFCLAEIATSLDPSRMIRSLAAQLATQFDGYREALDSLPLEALLNEEIDPGTLLRRLLAEPLRAETSAEPALLVVDALDEALAHPHAPDIARLLRDRMADFPPWIRIVVTTRKVPEVMDLLGLDTFEIDPACRENRTDLAAYLESRFAEPELAGRITSSDANLDALRSAIADQSNGNFLYVTKAVEALRSGVIDPGLPERIPAGLVGIYNRFFERCFGQGHASFDAVRPMLEVIVAAFEPIDSARIGVLLDRDPFDVEAALDPLTPFFPCRDGVYRPYHKSIVDWLTGAVGASRIFRLNVRAGHRRFADRVSRDFQAGSADRYGLTYLPSHLLAAGRADEAIALLLDYRWLSSKLRALDIWAVIRDFGLFNAKSGEPFTLVRDALRLSSHVLVHNKDQLSSQFVGRLRAIDRPEIRTLVLAAERTPSRPNLLLRTPTLTTPGGPLLRTLAGHERAVTAFALVPNSTTIVSASEDHTVRIWDYERGNEVFTLHGHGQPVTAVAVVPDASRLLSGSGRIYANHLPGESSLRVWDLRNGQCQSRFLGHTDDVYAILTTHNGRYVISASRDGTLRQWEIAPEAGDCRILTDQLLVSSNPLLAPDGSRFAALTTDGMLRIWRSDASEEYSSIALPLSYQSASRAAHEVCFNPDWSRYVQSLPGEVRVYDVTTGSLLHAVPIRGFISALAFSPDACCAAMATIEFRQQQFSVCSVIIIDLTTGAVAKLLSDEIGHKIHLLRYSPNGRQLAYARGPSFNCSRDHGIFLLDVLTQQTLVAFEAHTGAVTGLAFAPSGDLLISASADGALKVWDLTHNRARPVQTGPITRLLFAGGETRVISGSEDGRVRIWGADGVQKETLSGHTGSITDIAITADGRHAISSSHDGSMKVWNLESASVLHTYRGHRERGHTDIVWAVAVIPEIGLAISASHDRTVKVWSVDTGRTVITLRGHRDEVVRLFLAPNGRFVVSEGGPSDDAIRIWNLETYGQIMLPIPMSVVGVTGDSKRVVTIRDNVITGWDPYTGDRAFVVAGSRAGVRSIAMSGDGRLAVSTSFDGTTMEIWKLGLTEATLEESRSGVLWGDVQSISSDNRLAFCCRGKLLTVCELATGALIGSFIADCDFVGLNSFGRKHTLVVSLDGRVVVAGDIAGNIHVLSLTLE